MSEKPISLLRRRMIEDPLIGKIVEVLVTQRPETLRRLRLGDRNLR